MKSMFAVLVVAVVMLVTASGSVAESVTNRAFGPVVICGNELSSAYVFTVHDDKVYYGPYQAWPPIVRESKFVKAPIPERIPDTLAVRWREVKREVFRSVADDVRAGIINVSSPQLAYAYTNRFNACREIVDTAWVSPVSGNPWVRFKTSWGVDSTEIMLGDWSPPLESAAESWAKLWNDLREIGSAVYVGHGYKLYVPVEEVDRTRTKFEQMRRGGAAEESVPSSFRAKNRLLVEQLRHPVPPDSLRTWR